MAWPSATAPPLTFTFAGSMPSSLSTATACTANASFSSKRSTSRELPAGLLARRGAPLRPASSARTSAPGRSSPAPTMRASGVRPSACARSAAITTSADAPSLTPGALPAVTVPSFLNAGFSAASACGGGVGADRLVAIDDERRALLLRDRRSAGSRRRTRPRRSRARRLLMAARGVVVLRVAADVVVLGDDLAGVAHVALLERAPQAVVDHRVDDLAVAHAQPVAHARQQVGAVAHRLHAAGDGDVDVADARSPGRRASPPSGPSRTPC